MCSTGHVCLCEEVGLCLGRDFAVVSSASSAILSGSLGWSWPDYQSPIIPTTCHQIPGTLPAPSAGSSLALNLGHQDTAGGWRHVPDQGQSRREGGQPWASGLGCSLRHTLGCELGQHIVQVAGIWVAVAREVGSKLRLVVDLVPHHSVRLARGIGRADGEDESPLPGRDEQPQHLVGRAQEQGPAGVGGGRSSAALQLCLPPSPATLWL